jgi:hypothetical protein
LPHICVGIWSGPVVCGIFGYETLKHAGGLGLGYNHVVELQEYAALMRYSIVANWQTYDLIKAAPCVRLLAVDVLDYSSRCRKQKSTGPMGEVVFEVIEEITANDDEWMYQLAASKSALQSDEFIMELWSGLQQGMHDLSNMVDRLKQCRDTGDVHVSSVCDAIEVVAGQYPRLPYRRSATGRWDQSTGSATGRWDLRSTGLTGSATFEACPR